MVVVLLKMVLVDLAAHAKHEELGCIFEDSEDSNYSHDEVHHSSVKIFRILTTEVFAALSVTILYASFLEFICAQSPQSMKGMLIGMAYAMLLGFFRLLRVILQALFISMHFDGPLSCASVYYSIDLLICLTAFVIFVRVSKGYKYRRRDEPSRVRQYAEDYYSNPQQEQNRDMYSLL